MTEVASAVETAVRAGVAADMLSKKVQQKAGEDWRGLLSQTRFAPVDRGRGRESGREKGYEQSTYTTYRLFSHYLHHYMYTHISIGAKRQDDDDHGKERGGGSRRHSFANVAN